MCRPRLAAAVLFLLGGQTFAIQPSQTQPADGTSLEELRATARTDQQRAEHASRESDRLVGLASREESAGRNPEALELYKRAVELDLTNERALEGLRAAQERLGLQVSAPPPLADRAAKELRVKRQEARYRFDAAIESAWRGIVSGDAEGLQKARLQLDRARVVRSSRGEVFSRDELAKLDAQVNEYDLLLKTAVHKHHDANRPPVRPSKKITMRGRSLGI